jgi:uncharacterized protein (TIGR03437 family)
MTSLSLKLRSTIATVFVGLTLAVPSAFSQTLTITGGQGQLIGSSQQTNLPLVVNLVGPNGQPLTGAPITFTSLDQNGGYIPSYTQTVLTDSNGNASSNYIGANLIAGSTPAYDTGVVTASYAGVSTVTFYETTYNINQQGGSLVSANFSAINYTASYTGSAGTVSPYPIQVQVTSQYNYGVYGAGTGVPDVALSLVVASGSTGSISCLEGAFVLTNSAGIATCTPVFGSVGTGTFTFSIGNAVTSQVPIPYQVTVGPPALIQITSGNNQSGTPGKQLPLPIVAVVTDLGGNPTPNIPMTFTSVTPGGATFTSVRPTTDSAGKVSAVVILGSVPGNITISLADTAGLIKAPAIFTETVNLTVTGLTLSSGNQQTAFENAQFANPLVVQLGTANNQAATGTPVTFAVTSGSASIANPNTTVNSSNTAQTTVTAGPTPGPVVITATSGQYSVTFNLNVIPPGPANLTFTNGASGAVNVLSPGAIVTIYGQGLANGIQGVTSASDVGPLPLSLAGVTVQIGGQYYAPIFDVGTSGSNQFLTILVPREVPVGATSITISISGGGSSTVPITILPASPGIFTYTAANNQLNAVVIKANGTVAGPSNPATRGETVVLYLTGLPLTPGIATNAFPAPGSSASPAYPIILGVANQGAAYQSVAYSPDLAGVETISFTVPTSATPGAATVALGVQAPSGIVYSQGATLYIQ